MKKQLLNIRRIALAALLAVIGVAQGWADECCSRGIAYCILNDGSGKIVNGVGEVYVSLTADATPEWTADTYSTQIVVNEGKGSSGSVKQDFYFWAKAKTGYKFVGWNTSATSKSPASGSTTEAAPYKKTYTHWSAGSQTAPKEQKMYAIFEKEVSADSEPADLGDGAAVVRVEGNEYLEGSSAKNFSIKIIFNEGLQFKDKSSVSSGYGVNAAMLPYVTCKQGDNVVKVAGVTVNAAFKEGSYSEYEDAYGVLEMPYSIANGEYDVHIPYGLFNTANGGVTSSYDFKLKVLVDESPMSLLQTFPANGDTWKANPSNDQDVDYKGESVIVTLTFDKPIATVDASKEVTLTRSGRVFKAEKVNTSLINKKEGVVLFGKMSNGNYQFNIPANVFIAANGQGNEAVSVNFNIINSTVNEWALPVYSNVTATPANNAKVRSLTSLDIVMTDDEYDDPIGIVPNSPEVVAVKMHTYYDPSNDSPEYTGTIVSDTLKDVTVKVKAGHLMVNFAKPVAEQCKVYVSIPAGIINNLPMPIADMTLEERFKEGACTNEAMAFTFEVEPVLIKAQSVTNAKPLSQTWLYDANGNVMKDKYGNYACEYTWQNMVDATLVPEQDYVSYILFWFPEDFAKISYKGNATVKNLSNGKELGVAAVEFRTGTSGDNHKYDVLQLRLSSSDYLKFADLHQGLYEVTLPDSVAVTADGMYNAGYTFQFTYGDPSKAYVPEPLQLDGYVGDYVITREIGEIVEQEESFTFIKTGDNAYAVTDLCGSKIVIPVEQVAERIVLKSVDDPVNGAFMGSRGGDVDMLFQKDGSKYYIYIDQFAIYQEDADPIIGGIRNYVKVNSTPTGISSISSDNAIHQMYNLAGQRLSRPAGIVVIDGKKYIAK